VRAKKRCTVLPQLRNHFSAVFFVLLSCFLRKYQASHVMMKIGRMSAPGTSSNRDTSPIQRNIARQAIIPTTSSMSPTTGKSKTAATYSLMSSTIQSMSENNSTSVKTKYSGKGLNSSFRSPKTLSPYNNTRKIRRKRNIKCVYACAFSERRAPTRVYKTSEIVMFVFFVSGIPSETLLGVFTIA